MRPLDLLWVVSRANEDINPLWRGDAWLAACPNLLPAKQPYPQLGFQVTTLGKLYKQHQHQVFLKFDSVKIIVQ